MTRYFYGCSALALGLAVATTPAFSQTAPVQSTADPQGATQLDEIVVTSQRRSESLQRVPASVEVLSGEALQAAHVSNLANVQDLSPSLIVTQSSNPSAGVFTVRGVGTAVTDRGFEQSVGVYIDGVFRGRPGAALQDLLDIDRVEVLRGPQSTLFGRNNSAGAINISTDLPSTSAYKVYGEATYGNYNDQEYRLSVNLPLVTDKLALRLAGSDSSRDGTVDAPNLPEGDVNARDRQSVRGQLYWTPTEQTRLRLIADYSTIDDRCCSYLQLFASDRATNAPFQFNVRGGLIGSTAPTPGTRGVSPSDAANTGVFYRPFDRVSMQDNVSVEHSIDKGVSLQVDHDIGGLTLTAIGATRKYNTDIDIDADGTNSATANLQSRPSTDISEDSVEVRLQNETGGPVEFVVGGYYFNQKIIDTNLLLATIKPIATTVPFFNSTGVGTAESYAAFGQATYNVTDKFRLTGGLRYLTEEKTAVVTVAPGTFSFPGAAETKDDVVMGTAIAAYQPNMDTNFYLRYARGYKSAAINLLFTVPQAFASPVVDPETTDAYEAGAKFRLLDGRLTTNLAVYTQTVNDQQVQSFNSTTGTFITLNAAKVRSRGVEADVVYRPIPLLTFNANVSYLDAEYESFPGAPPQAGSSALNQDLTGRAPPNAPRWTVVGGVSLDKPLTNDITLLGNLSVRHASSYYTDLPLTEAFRNGDTNFVNASAELAFSNGVGVQVWGRNLTGEDTYLTGIAPGGGNGSLAAFVNDPKTYGVTVRYRY